MTDDKYGRLVTGSELEELINVATAAATLGEVLDAEQCIERFEHEQGSLTFPKDEPLFLIRGQDEAAFETTVKYIEECERLGASDEHVRAATHASGKLMAWQQMNKDRVKVP